MQLNNSNKLRGDSLRGPPPLSLDEIECDLDEEADNEHFSGKHNINDSFINKLRDISTFNPSGIKGKEKDANSVAGYGLRDN